MLRLFQPSTPDPRWSRQPLTGVTLLIHLAVVAGLLIPLKKLVINPLLDHEMVFLVPPNQKGGTERVEGQLAFQSRPQEAGQTQGGTPAAAVEEAAQIESRGQVPEYNAAELGQTALIPREEKALTELEVDSTVMRDPRSAAPSYPPSLLAKGITGFAQVRYVVDTLGTVDTLTYRVVVATHPDFAVAVRRVLPDMRFRPAIVGGHPVRQWVEQTFHFRITRDTTGSRLMGGR